MQQPARNPICWVSGKNTNNSGNTYLFFGSRQVSGGSPPHGMQFCFITLNLMKQQLFVSLNMHVEHCNNTDNSPQDFHLMTLVVAVRASLSLVRRKIHQLWQRQISLANIFQVQSKRLWSRKKPVAYLVAYPSIVVDKNFFLLINDGEIPHHNWGKVILTGFFNQNSNSKFRRTSSCYFPIRFI